MFNKNTLIISFLTYTILMKHVGTSIFKELTKTYDQNELD
jgi:hypothetical protein